MRFDTRDIEIKRFPVNISQVLEKHAGYFHNRNVCYIKMRRSFPFVQERRNTYIIKYTIN